MTANFLKLKLPLLALAFVLMISCNEGGIVGTGDGDDAELEGGSEKPADDLSNASDGKKELPKIIMLPTQPSLIGLNANPEPVAAKVLQKAYQARELRYLRIQLELLYLDAAMDTIAAFCKDYGSGEVCHPASTDLNVNYTADTIAREAELRQKIAVFTQLEQVSQQEKLGTALPLGDLSFVVGLGADEFLNHLSSQRINIEGDLVAITVHWSDNNPNSRIFYESSSNGESISSLQYFSNREMSVNNSAPVTRRVEMTERVQTTNDALTEVFTLTTFAEDLDAPEHLLQADLRRARVSGDYQHFSWDGQASATGSFLLSRLSEDNELLQPVTATRMLLDENGVLNALETCDDSATGSLCADDTSQWITADGLPVENGIVSAALFMNEALIQNWKGQLNGASQMLTDSSSSTESFVLVPVGKSVTSGDIQLTATRNTADSPFRHYRWRAGTSSEFDAYEEQILPQTLQYDSLVVGEALP